MKDPNDDQTLKSDTSSDGILPDLLCEAVDLERGKDCAWECGEARRLASWVKLAEIKV